MNRQNLFETILRVTGFTPLESDMDEIQRAVMPEHNDMCLRNDSLLDKVKELELQLAEKDKRVEYFEKHFTKIENEVYKNSVINLENHNKSKDEIIEELLDFIGKYTHLSNLDNVIKLGNRILKKYNADKSINQNENDQL